MIAETKKLDDDCSVALLVKQNHIGKRKYIDSKIRKKEKNIANMSNLFIKIKI